jgi:histone H3/H4
VKKKVVFATSAVAKKAPKSLATLASVSSSQKKPKPVVAAAAEAKKPRTQTEEDKVDDDEDDEDDDDDDEADEEDEDEDEDRPLKRAKTNGNGNISTNKKVIKRKPLSVQQKIFCPGFMKRMCNRAGIQKKNTKTLRLLAEIVGVLAEVVVEGALKNCATRDRMTVTCKDVKEASLDALAIVPFSE